jgi:hypothetical protein
MAKEYVIPSSGALLLQKLGGRDCVLSEMPPAASYQFFGTYEDFPPSNDAFAFSPGMRSFTRSCVFVISQSDNVPILVREATPVAPWFPDLVDETTTRRAVQLGLSVELVNRRFAGFGNPYIRRYFDRCPTSTSPRIQRGSSDWEFLQRLIADLLDLALGLDRGQNFDVVNERIRTFLHRTAGLCGVPRNWAVA